MNIILIIIWIKFYIIIARIKTAAQFHPIPASRNIFNCDISWWIWDLKFENASYEGDRINNIW
jgi:hypothetical protein